MNRSESRVTAGLNDYRFVACLHVQHPSVDPDEVTAALRRAAACQSFTVETVRFYLRLKERSEQVAALPSCERWGLAGIERAPTDLSRYESLVV